MTNLARLYRSAITLGFLAVVLPWLTHCAVVAPRPEDQIVPREVSAGERDEMARLIAARFNQPTPAEAGLAAAGPFHFVNSREFIYLDRTDVGSVGFERSRYGVSSTALESAALERDALLARTETALTRTGLRAEGRQFETFLDEFAGAAEPRGLSIDFDPRSASRHIARTVAFRRTLEGVPVFNSELVVGLMPDGSIGRFRLHWPQIDAKVVEDAIALQRAMRGQQWVLPDSLKRANITILETTAGIGHSGFADPGFRAQAVIRVLYRKRSESAEYPLTSTGYAYFDANSREVVFSRFPTLAGNAASEKPPAVR